MDALKTKVDDLLQSLSELPPESVNDGMSLIRSLVNSAVAILNPGRTQNAVITIIERESSQQDAVIKNEPFDSDITAENDKNVFTEFEPKGLMESEDQTYTQVKVKRKRGRKPMNPQVMKKGRKRKDRITQDDFLDDEEYSEVSDENIDDSTVDGSTELLVGKNEVLYQCIVCQMDPNPVFISQVHLMEHLEDKHADVNEDGQAKLKCTYCDVTELLDNYKESPISDLFAWMSKMGNHMTTLHEMEILVSQPRKLRHRTLTPGGIKHKRKYSGINYEGNFDCTFCEDSFGNKLDFINHIKESHVTIQDDIGMLECMDKSCDYSLKYKNFFKIQPSNSFCWVLRMIQHMHVKHNTELPAFAEYSICDQCDFKTIIPGYLKVHMTSHDPPSEDKRVPCPICDETFIKCYLKSHIERKHTQTNKKRNSEHEIDYTGTFNCSFCSEPVFYDKLTFLEHIKKAHVEVNEEDTAFLKCLECTYTTRYKNLRKCQPSNCFAWVLRMVQHLYEKHAKTLPDYAELMMCDQCDFKTIVPGNFRIHQQSHTNPVDKEKELCPFCGLSMSKTHLNVHIKKIHSPKDPNEPIKKYKCHICNKEYSSATSCQLHKAQMHGEKNNWTTYTCDRCSKIVPSKRSLYEHVLVIHGLNISKMTPLCCELCPYKTFKPTSLATHKLCKHNTIRDVICDICGKKFKTQNTLISHKKTHNRGKKWVCAWCDYSSVFKENTFKHMRQTCKCREYNDTVNSTPRLVIDESVPKDTEATTYALQNAIGIPVDDIAPSTISADDIKDLSVNESIERPLSQSQTPMDYSSHALASSDSRGSYSNQPLFQSTEPQSGETQSEANKTWQDGNPNNHEVSNIPGQQRTIFHSMEAMVDSNRHYLLAPQAHASLLTRYEGHHPAPVIVDGHLTPMGGGYIVTESSPQSHNSTLVSTIASNWQQSSDP
ncbi:unnamed protein product [Owenia fusiformis]|uniref:Uncharacterized protein n=1 Tax=Owenia fusiformis TaxID=6347 RepID=A0A8J1UPN4_OWEFU|nr:unnamed protein product [Owenia fusiformis]